MKKVVVVGGGTGTHTVLRGLKRYAGELSVSAVVTMADSGGSTGRLRDEFGQLPVGDVRMALTALAAEDGDHNELLRQLFLYRFEKGEGLAGHNFGNLLLTALTDLTGSEVAAIKTASQVLRVAGTVLPVSTGHTHLRAMYDDGVVLEGEHHIDTPPGDRHERRIVDLSLTDDVSLYTETHDALTAADMIVCGPGDLYTSVLANAVVPGFKDSIQASEATLVYIVNLMTRSGQTVGMTAHDHVAEISRYFGRTPDVVLYNTTPLPSALLAHYAEEGTAAVPLGDTPWSLGQLQAGDYLATEEVKTVKGDVLRRSLLRHDSDKLAATLCSLLATPH